MPAATSRAASDPPSGSLGEWGVAPGGHGASRRWSLGRAARLLPVPFDEASVARLAGWYAAPDGRTIELRPTDGRLVLHLPNGLRSLVLARGDDEFFTAAAPLTFAAEQGEDGAVSGLMVSVRGEAPVLAARVEAPQRQ